MNHITFTEWKDKYSKAKAIADRIARMKNDRARKTCAAAGLSPDLLGIHPHNAMVSFEYGHPWPNVDYSLVRKTLWLLEHEFDASRIVDKYSDRLWEMVVR